MMNLMKKYWWVILVFLALFFPTGKKKAIYKRVNRARKASGRMAWQGYYASKDLYKKRKAYRFNNPTARQLRAIEKRRLAKQRKTARMYANKARARKLRQSRTGLKY